ncbi:MAG: FAD-dependent oxidoreductase [Pseudomonadales bacterium]
MKRFDHNLVVVGAGSAGLVAALVASTARARVVLVECDKMGGDCLHTGCVPSKALIASARTVHQLNDATNYGLRNVRGDVDFKAVMSRVHGVIASIAPKDSVERYESLGVTCVHGHAEIRDPHCVFVDGVAYKTKNIIIASGAEPVTPPIPGLDDDDCFTSTNLWSIEELPRRLVVVGGGPIGCELAQAFGRLGSEVTLVEIEDRLLPREDQEVGAMMADIFRGEGVRVLTGYRPDRCIGKRLTVMASSSVEELDFDRILIAAGRSPRTTGMGIEKLGVRIKASGTLAVDRYLRTTVDSIYAAGDVVGPYQFTHMAGHQAWVAAVNSLARPFWRYALDETVVPWATFTDPEIARVGLSEAQARATGRDVVVTRYELEDVDRAQIEGRTQGFIKLVTTRGSDRLLGALVVAPEAGEIISEYVTAMTHGFGLRKILSTIHVYPTRMDAARLAAGTWRRANVSERLLHLSQRMNDYMRL